MPAHNLTNLWDVLLLYLIPIGGGIPAGVLLAQKRGLDWPIMMALYFISDVILACAFEPIMFLFIKYGKRYQFFARMGEVMKLMIQKTIEHYGNRSGVIPLVMIAFGADPMTGRAVAGAAGHGFFTGWAIAIAGDMIYFSLLMVSTLWLHNILGDGTVTMFIILGFMMILPTVIRWFEKKFQRIK